MSTIALNNTLMSRIKNGSRILVPGPGRWSLNLNLNSLLVKRQVDNPSPGAVTGGN